MLKKYFGQLLLFFCCIQQLSAQDYKLFVSAVPKQNAVQLKWLSKEPLKGVGFNIYRKENAGWIKINTQPVTESPVIKTEDFKNSKNPFPSDSAYSFYISIKNEPQNDAQTMQNNDFVLYYAATMNNNLAKHLGIYFLDNTVVNGKSYTYKLTQSSNEKELAVSDKITYTSFSKSAAPADFKATAGDKKIDFFWKNTNNFIAYNLFLNENKNLKKINEDGILVNRIQDKKYPFLYGQTDLINGQTYSYQLTGIDYFGNESELSPLVTAIPFDNTIPYNVRNLQAKYTDNAILLQWKHSLSDDVKGYNIFKSAKDTNSFKKLNNNLLSTKDTMFTDKNVTADGTTYLYYIESVDANNNSAKSPVIYTFIPDHVAPSMPKDAVSKVVDGKVSISWTKNIETDLAGYRVYRGLKDDDENSMLLLNSKPKKETSFTDTFPKKTGTKFIYKIRAIDKSFNESEPSIVIAQLPDVMPPSAPVLTQVKYYNNNVTLKWNSPSENDLKGFKILRKSETEREFVAINTNFITSTEKTYEDKTITKNANYMYAVQSEDNAGNISQSSNSMFVNTNSSTSINNANTNLTARYDKTNKQVILNYKVNDKNDNIEGYVIFRKMEKTNPKQLFTPTKAGTYTDKNIQEGNTYFYFIKAVFINGDLSDASESVKVETK